MYKNKQKGKRKEKLIPNDNPYNNSSCQVKEKHKLLKFGQQNTNTHMQ